MNASDDRLTAAADARRRGSAVLALALLAGLLLWSHWPVFRAQAKDWMFQADYAGAALVPPAALYLLWHDRQRLRRTPLRPDAAGLALLALGQLVRLAGLLFIFESLERYSLVLTIAGLVWLVAGRAVLREVRWILVFLLLMVPLPGRVHNTISAPLQGAAASGAVFLLELAGTNVIREGFTLVIDDRTRVGIAEACSGLRMLTAFILVTAVAAYVVDRPRWQKLVLLASSLPIAIGCNLLRLAVTALLYEAFDDAVVEQFSHDFAGLAMMPLAAALLIGELKLLRLLEVPEPAAAAARGGDARGV